MKGMEYFEIANPLFFNENTKILECSMEMQKLANEKTQEIITAYEAIKKTSRNALTKNYSLIIGSRGA